MSAALALAPSNREVGTAAALFTPFDLAGLHLANRTVVSPMTRVSATGAGHATAQMRDYYGAFAAGGFGLVITEGIYTDRAYSQGYFNQPGLADEAQAEAWRAVVDSVHASGGKILAQLMHAGALSQGNPHHALSVGPSAVTPKGTQLTSYRGEGPYQTPVAMTQADINAAVRGFARAAQHAQAAGFDGVEVHGANGYLLDQFLTEGVNIRTDSYGGPVAARAKLLLQVLHAVRSSVDRGFVVGVRISQGKVNDFEHRWAGREEDAELLFSMLAPHVDYIHTTEYEAWRPACSPEGRNLAALAKVYSGLPVIANGGLHNPMRASELLAGGAADLISIGRGALASADWPARVRDGRSLPNFDGNMLLPIADLASADRWQTASFEQQYPVLVRVPHLEPKEANMAIHATTDRLSTPRSTSALHRISGRGEAITRLGSFAITITLSIIFLWFGSLKFIGFEQEGLVGIISNNPLISWLYPVFGQPAGGAMFLGVVEIATGLLILGRLVDPRLSAIGGAIGVFSFFVTVTCMFTTPGVIQPSWEGTLALSPGLGAFLVKDIVLFAACLWLLGVSLTAVHARRGF